MADIFLSYVRSDAGRAKQVADALSALGWSVWWDELTPGTRFRDKINEELHAARCVVVLWSKRSIASDFVVDEAEDGKRRGVLVQALIEDVNPPHGFQQIQAARLLEWDAFANWPDWGRIRQGDGLDELVEQITRHVTPTSSSDQRVPAASQTESSDRLLGDESPRRHRVFLCYRRQDTQGHTGRLRDRLVGVYGNESVFMDVDNVPTGVDFVDYIESILSTCALMVVLIGPSWTTIHDRKGRRKLDQPDDLVREEIATALKRKIPVIPVLVEDATMPDSDDVPEEIRGLTRRNAIELTHRRWNSDVQQVLTAVAKFMEPKSEG